MSDAFQDADDASAIYALAGEILRIINGIARVRLDRPDPLSLGNVRRYRDGGAKDAFGFPAPIRARLRMGTPSIVVNGVPVPPRSWERDVQLANRDERVWAVLTFLAIRPTWHSLYAALDTILNDRRTGAERGVTSWANVPAAQLELFRRTANSSRAVGAEARHGPEFKAPGHPIASLGEGFAAIATSPGHCRSELAQAREVFVAQLQPSSRGMENVPVGY
jgi:hypothetical protein